MRIRLVLGAAGTGKTFLCLKEAKEALLVSPDGPPMLFLAPKQGTYQLEQQLLAEPSLAGYTRLRILSFEGLANFLLGRLRNDAPRILDEEGRIMVLRNLLAKRRESLKLFRASARLTGFAQQLSLVLHEFQRHQATPQSLESLAAELQTSGGLPAKLQDLAALLQSYLDWLEVNRLHDPNSLLSMAAAAVRGAAPRELPRHGTQPAQLPSEPLELEPDSPVYFERIWVDGFAEFTEQELELLAALLPSCGEACLTFCLDLPRKNAPSWLSHWSAVYRSFDHCRKRLASVPGAEIVTEVLPRCPAEGRFTKTPVLQHLANHWGEPEPFRISTADDESEELGESLQVVVCANPKTEAKLAAHEVLRHVRAGGRYRDIAVILRHLQDYHSIVERLFSRYGIPFFLDRRESVAHHPLAELTRSTLRTLAFGWHHEDWFSALKSGLMPCQDKEIDLLENEALARGWHGNSWLKPIRLKDSTTAEPDRERLRQLESHLERIRRQSVLPLEKIMLDLGGANSRVSGAQLAEAIRRFWEQLQVQERLTYWTEAEARVRQRGVGPPVHETVWNQINAWLANAELAFPEETLPLKEWLPILEAGLATLTVGVIPPALDQVLIAAVDRSRTPEVKLAIVLGLNETIFPARPANGGLLSEADRLQLESRNLIPSSTARHHLSRESYLAYIACTRPRERLVLTCSLSDSQGVPLNQSTFLSNVRNLFPSVVFKAETASPDWRACEHVSELVVPVLKMGNQPVQSPGAERLVTHPPQMQMAGPFSLPSVPDLLEVVEQVRQIQSRQLYEDLSSELAARLYGPVLRSSVSRMEQFAACPFKFFAHSGLRAEERKSFELDVKEQGTFQHDVLALFHQQLQADGKRWRDVTPQEARQRIAATAQSLIATYRHGLLDANEKTRFMARVLTDSLQDFVEILVGWMRTQYEFDPVAVELPFGSDDIATAWVIDLEQGHQLELYGRIDRVDLHRRGDDEALCVVVDYKSSQKQLDSLLIANGLQLQLLTYLNVLHRWPTPRALFSVKRIIPAGVFYASLRGRYDRQPNRTEALAEPETARKLAYQHSGRFDARFLPQLDNRPNVVEGDQFRFRITASGEIHRASREALKTEQFKALLDEVEQNLKGMAVKIFSGVTEVAPYRKASSTACDQCDFQSICRMDPWTQTYRVLKSSVRRLP